MRRAAMVATTAGLIGCLCVLFAFQDGVRGGRLVAVLLVSVACVATGILMITSGGDEPIFLNRPKYVVGSAVAIGGSIGSVYMLGPGSTSPERRSRFGSSAKWRSLPYLCPLPRRDAAVDG